MPYFKCAPKRGLFVKASGIEKTNTKKNRSAPRVTVGDVVQCTKQKCKGTIRFIGTPYSVKKSGVYYGVELEVCSVVNVVSIRLVYEFTECVRNQKAKTTEQSKNVGILMRRTNTDLFCRRQDSPR